MHVDRFYSNNPNALFHRIALDKLKDEICIKFGVTLIRIPFTLGSDLVRLYGWCYNKLRSVRPQLSLTPISSLHERWIKNAVQHQITEDEKTGIDAQFTRARDAIHEAEPDAATIIINTPKLN
jgi:hypothetical protein